MRWFLSSVIVLLVALGIYVGSALISLGGLVASAQKGDSAGVIARTDLTRLRRSLVDQIVSAYLKQLGRDRPVKPIERMAANTYGASVADATIAKLLTEENLTGLLKGGAISLSGDRVVNMPGLGDIGTLQMFETLKRVSFVKPVEFLVRLGEIEKDGAISIHFEGDGWKLSGIRLPDAAVELLAQNLAKPGRNG